MAKTLRWGVMGLGLQGQRLMSAIERARTSELGATASEREAGSFVSMLKNENVDAVAVATPNDQHAKHVIAAANAHKHILCEKPLALTMRDARAMKRAVDEAGVYCFVNFHLRTHPEILAAKERVALGALGTIESFEMEWSIGGLAGEMPALPEHMRWREDPKRAGGGALMARGVHLFDALRFLSGSEVQSVGGETDASASRVDREIVCDCTLENGATARIKSSKIDPKADNRIVIRGTSGSLEIRKPFTDDPGAMYVRVFEYFSEAIERKTSPLATIDDGIAVVDITERFIESAHHRETTR